MIPLNEIVETFFGELPEVGKPCVLVRIAGCNLACDYCDTSDNEIVREWLSAKDLADRILASERENVMITGGEPLLCARTAELIEMLLDSGLRIVLETNGSIPLSCVPEGAIKSVDIKTPSSGHAGCFLESNLNYISPKDTVKFVMGNRQDFDWSIKEIERLDLIGRAELVFSPVWGKLEPAALAEWILETKMPIRLSIQIHKIIGIK